MPLRRIRVTVGTQMATLELDTRERLRHRASAKQLMQRLKPIADEIISKQPKPLRCVDTAPPLLPSAVVVRGKLSIDHIPIFAMEGTEEQTEPEIFSSCVSFIQGTFVEGVTTSPSRILS
jgi:hypothetical protein